MNTLVTICARGGSKGIPGKNIKSIAGKPLIAYSIEHALKIVEERGAVAALSTDSDEIREVAAGLGLKTTYKRPAELATDQAGKIPVLNDLLQYEESKAGKEFDFLIDLDVTSPLRNVTDINEAFDALLAKQDAQNIFSVNPANRNPYFNMVEEDPDGFYKLCKKGTFVTRQSAPKVYDLNASFYIYRKSFFTDKEPSAITSRSLIHEMKHICFDLDHPIDFLFMEYLLENNKLGFNL
ncbi:N-acylneuraminate cytidylyltransferase/CMP-N,N'-diacetyllegionaminic acid synthase [Chitinophaga dinghuensis]|uniref:N-acylneuraminate cytidylyltransferase/CMP-N,N'-diacetyllegionaminic acid synthase n=1 Tax=Chitinophaga dinghuensis TaxID=1539050 RepID=A0A327WEG5_9BACT|nr:acylneuraminate cytidylyltransferase family protein [Chitinophaga dinghuensis]RAJ85806.1 N-acylneuraminate cytidylyltransferase/CMP-N,N'-diacetyllegionaminic acid synthase [Chitinophaga dinghuensis]